MYICEGVGVGRRVRKSQIVLGGGGGCKKKVFVSIGAENVGEQSGRAMVQVKEDKKKNKKKLVCVRACLCQRDCV